jgi:hypothetical protein
MEIFLKVIKSIVEIIAEETKFIFHVHNHKSQRNHNVRNSEFFENMTSTSNWQWRY